MPKTTSDRAQQIADLYASDARLLEHIVAQRAHTAAQTIEDACAFAWEQLLTHPTVAVSPPWRVRAWLATTATRQAWRLNADRHVPVGPWAPITPAGIAPGTLSEPADPTITDPAQRAEDRLTHEQRVDDLHDLKLREQRDLLLQAAGLTYDEIARRTDSTRTAVNRRINEGRAHLRRLAADHQPR